MVEIDTDNDGDPDCIGPVTTTTVPDFPEPDDPPPDFTLPTTPDPDGPTNPALTTTTGG